MAGVNHWQLPLGGLDQARSLHRMLMDRKFDCPADEFFGSPHIAAIQHSLADMLAAAEPHKDWNLWRQADHQPHRVEQIRDHLRQSRSWPTMQPETRRQYVLDLLAPLIPSDVLLDELVNITNSLPLAKITDDEASLLYKRILDDGADPRPYMRTEHSTHLTADPDCPYCRTESCLKLCELRIWLESR
jgi:hypothetical protein